MWLSFATEICLFLHLLNCARLAACVLVLRFVWEVVWSGFHFLLFLLFVSWAQYAILVLLLPISAQKALKRFVSLFVIISPHPFAVAKMEVPEPATSWPRWRPRMMCQEWRRSSYGWHCHRSNIMTWTQARKWSQMNIQRGLDFAAPCWKPLKEPTCSWIGHRRGAKVRHTRKTIWQSRLNSPRWAIWGRWNRVCSANTSPTNFGRLGQSTTASLTPKGGGFTDFEVKYSGLYRPIGGVLKWVGWKSWVFWKGRWSEGWLSAMRSKEKSKSKSLAWASCRERLWR